MDIIGMDEQLTVQMGKGQLGVYCVHLINVQNLIGNIYKNIRLSMEKIAVSYRYEI